MSAYLGLSALIVYIFNPFFLAISVAIFSTKVLLSKSYTNTYLSSKVSFHAVVFSTIYNKNIAIVNRTENINTRMRDLLDDLQLKGRLINENYKLDNILNDIEYEKPNEIIAHKVQLSKQYLNDILSIKNREVI